MLRAIRFRVDPCNVVYNTGRAAKFSRVSRIHRRLREIPRRSPFPEYPYPPRNAEEFDQSQPRDETYRVGCAWRGTDGADDARGEFALRFADPSVSRAASPRSLKVSGCSLILAINTRRSFPLRYYNGGNPIHLALLNTYRSSLMAVGLSFPARSPSSRSASRFRAVQHRKGSEPRIEPWRLARVCYVSRFIVLSLGWRPARE